MTSPLTETSPSTRGRILAALYLFVIIAGITAQALIADRLVVGDDAARTAANILASKSLYRLGFTIFMLEMVAQVGVSLLYYDLLKPVNRSVARASAVIGLTKYIAGYWAKYGIRCNTICPGLTKTNIVVVGEGEIKDKKEHETKIPLGRIAEPEDMAKVVLFLVSDESGYMTGQTLHVNGGKYMYCT